MYRDVIWMVGVIHVLLLTVATGPASSVPAPKYLAIADFKNCMHREDRGGYEAWCLPDKKPRTCRSKSWKDLQALDGQDRVPACQEKSKR